jgi:uncharacterized protein YjbJ (UPF0337 family)
MEIKDAKYKGADRDLENEGKEENLDGKVQVKVGKIKKVVGK